MTDRPLDGFRIVELTRGDDGEAEISRKTLLEHQKLPADALTRELERWSWEGVAGAAVSDVPH